MSGGQAADNAMCESCGSTNTQQTGSGSNPFPGDGTPTLVTYHECLDCTDAWNVWH
ncbi:hypothetical protein [Nonomuraea sp. WAC 01424]|uniref:hypothetical protein n=1 Tax=Nonomuraea sp. WAC 01424 TaxID=2203200 RepID=UPI00163CAF58|nr:hypothetical protein [Nonomuraea sp. WAC 01424]